MLWMVNKLFDNLEMLMQRYNFHPNNIYNLDETGITTVQGKPSRVLALKGRKQVGSVTSAERGLLFTVEICMSATGAFLPPMFVFPRVRMKDELMDGAPHGSISVCHPTGWMQKDLFTTWFNNFQCLVHHMKIPFCWYWMVMLPTQKISMWLNWQERTECPFWIFHHTHATNSSHWMCRLWNHFQRSMIKKLKDGFVIIQHAQSPSSKWQVFSNMLTWELLQQRMLRKMRMLGSKP